MPSQWPFGPAASICSSCALPFQTGLTVTVPLSSMDGELGENGSVTRRMWVCQVPMLKSKS